MDREKGTYQRRKRQTLSSLPSVIVTFLLTLFCWVVGYVFSIGFPMHVSPNDTPLWTLIATSFTSKTAAYLTGLALLFLAAFIHKQCSYALVIIKGKTMLPFLTFFIFVSTNTLLLPFHAGSVGVLFFIPAIYFLFRSYQDDFAVGVLFNTMAFLCMGSFFWAYLVWFIPLFFVGLYLLRSFSLRNFLAALLGVMIPCSMVLAWSVWKDDYALFVTPFNALLAFDLSFDEISYSFEWINIGFALLLLVGSAIHLFLQEFENSMRTRHYLLFLLAIGFYSFILMLIYREERMSFLLMLYLPTSLFLSYLFKERRKLRVVYLYYFILLFSFLLTMIHLWKLL